MAEVARGGPVGGLLVVDDVQDLRTLIKLMLGVEPRLLPQSEAATADEALARLDAHQPALIVLDNELQGSSLSGLEAAPELRARAPEAKILLFTAYDLSARADEDPAIDAFLRKDQITSLLPVAQELLGDGTFPAPWSR